MPKFLLILLFIIAMLVFSGLNSWKYNMVDLNSYETKCSYNVFGITWEGQSNKSNLSRWVTSIYGNRVRKWKLINGNPMVSRGCALGGAYKSLRAATVIYQLDNYDGIRSVELLHELDLSKYPLDSELLSQFESELNKKIDEKLTH